MKTHVSSHPLAAPLTVRGSSFSGVVRFLSDRFLWLPIGALVAVLWANLDAEHYFRTAHALAFPVNEIGMALFLGLIVHEAIDAIGPRGALHRWHHWGMAIIAAAGGVLGAAFAFLTFVSWRGEEVLVMAWPVACAIDIAAGYYVLRLIFRRSAAFAFLLLIGLATNAVGLVAMAVGPAFTQDHVTGAVFVIAAMGAAAAMHALGVRRLWPYVAIAGVASWWGFHVAGVHPALALVPIVPFLPHARRLLEPFAERAADDHVDRDVAPWLSAAHIVLFLFGLVNGGALLRGHDTGTWAVLLGALVGRPIGIVAAVALARLAGLRLPRSIGWRELTVIALATSSGFTFALFTAASLLPVGGVLTQVRVGALATALGAALTYVVARSLHVGRFAEPH